MNSITSRFSSLKNISHEAFIGFTEKTVTFPNSGLQTEYLKNVQPCAAAPTKPRQVQNVREQIRNFLGN